MKYFITVLFLTLTQLAYSQDVVEVKVPKHVVYHYCHPKALQQAKDSLEKCFDSNRNCNIISNHLIIGPTLWNRFQHKEKLQNLQPGNVLFYIDQYELKGKIAQNQEEAQWMWQTWQSELQKPYKIRKATARELDYHWSVISWDIEEPLLVLDTLEHQYILDFSENGERLFWVDELPKSFSDMGVEID